jgi:prolyl-tRNA editing enzyme YbaK/EbsC (Cys-tRNA(Pro) deacylase)
VLSPDPVLAAMDATGHPYEVLPCDPALADTAAFCAHYGVDPAESANCILVVGKADPPVHAACLVLATDRLDVNRAVRALLGTRKASFASADETRALTGMEIGGVTPPGLPEGMPLWIDEAVLAAGSVVIGGGSRDRKLRCEPAALLRLPGASAHAIRQT